MSKLSIAFTIVMVCLAMTHSVNAGDHAGIREEHVVAHKQHDQWSAEYAKMRVEHLRALAAFAKLQASIFEHEAELVEHEEAIRAQEYHAIHYWEEICEHDDHDDDAAHKQLEKEHAAFGASHAAMAKQHKQVKANHEELHALRLKINQMVKDLQ
jgi:hypothetical protein